MLALREVGQRDLVERMPHPLLQRLPERLNRAATAVHTGPYSLCSRMPLAITRIIEQRLAQGHHDRAERDFARRSSQPVATCSAAYTIDQARLPQNRQKLCHIGG